MRWLKRKLRNWLIENNSHDSVGMDHSYFDEYRSRPASDPTMHFKVFNASGGKLVEFRSDRVSKSNPTNSEDYKLYIIREDEDFGDAIKKIAMLHLLNTGG